MDHDHHHPSSESELAIERQLNAVVGTNLFDEQPPYLNSFFRFQLGSNTFDGMLHGRTSCQHLVPPIFPKLPLYSDLVLATSSSVSMFALCMGRVQGRSASSSRCEQFCMRAR